MSGTADGQGTRPRVLRKIEPAKQVAFDPDALKGVLTWASGGFALLTGLATFFGIKDGGLDRLVRNHPGQVLVVLFLVGLGIVFAVLAPALDVDRSGPLWLVLWPALLIGALAVLASPGSPTVGPGQGRVVAVASVAVIALMALGLWKAVGDNGVRWPLAAALLAVVSVAAGLFAAARIAVADKADVAGASISVDVAEKEGSRTVTVSAKGSDVTEPLRVVVEGLGRTGHRVLAAERLTPDRSDAIQADIAVPVLDTGWSELRVLTCDDDPLVDATSSKEPPCRDLDVVARFPLERRTEVVGAALVLGADGAVGYDVSASDVPVGGRVSVRIVVGTTVVASAVRGGSADGTVTWTGSLGKRTGTVTVIGSACPADGGECAPESELARLVVAGPTRR